jgi:hypothetical protein
VPDKDNAQMDLIVDGTLLMKRQLPRAMQSFERFKETAD